MNPPKAQIAFRIPEGSIALLPGLYSYYWHLSQSNLFELDGAAGVPNPANSALYWLAKMLHAAEDVGLADPMALVLATAACQAGEVIGWPEARIPIAEAALYIATANKSNSVVKAIDAALEDIRSGRTLAVPNHLRDGHYAGSKVLGHGEGYRYAHDFPGHHVAQDYLGAARRFYEPSTQGHERKIAERLDQWRKTATENGPHPSGQPSTTKTSPTL